jgi:hypothetical protein
VDGDAPRCDGLTGAAPVTAGDQPFPCPRCGGLEFEPGFVDDTVQGRVRWLPGRFERGVFGNAKGRMTRRRHAVLAYRCTACDRLEMYVGEQV